MASTNPRSEHPAIITLQQHLHVRRVLTLRKHICVCYNTPYTSSAIILLLTCLDLRIFCLPQHWAVSRFGKQFALHCTCCFAQVQLSAVHVFSNVLTLTDSFCSSVNWDTASNFLQFTILYYNHQISCNLQPDSFLVIWEFESAWNSKISFFWFLDTGFYSVAF